MGWSIHGSLRSAITVWCLVISQKHVRYVKPKMGWVPRSSLNKDDGSGSGIQNEIVEANSSDDWTQVSNRNARKDGSLKGKNCPLSPV